MQSARKGEDRVRARVRLEGAEGGGGGAAGAAQPAHAALATAEVRPDAEEQRSGGDSNLRTNVRARTRAGEAEPLVGGGSRGELPSAPAAGSARPGARREGCGGFIKGRVVVSLEGVIFPQVRGEGCANPELKVYMLIFPSLSQWSPGRSPGG